MAEGVGAVVRDCPSHPAAETLVAQILEMQAMDEVTRLEAQLAEAFHLMYGNFPEGVQLTHKSKRIVAANAAMLARGREVGMICATHGPAESHRGCLATKALQEQRPRWRQADAKPNGLKPIVYWIPLPGHPDYFLHFAIGSTVDYTVAQENA